MLVRKREKGIATFIALLVLAILTVIIFAISAQGVWNMNYVKLDTCRKSAFQGAETGVSEALLQFKEGKKDWDKGVGSSATPVSLSTGTQYYAQVFKPTTPNPPVEVKQGTLYFLGTGIDGKTSQQVGILIKDTSSGAFRYAIASAGDLKFKNTNVKGSIKCSGNLTQTSTVDVYPEEIKDSNGSITYGDGRVLVSKQIQNGVKQLNIHTDTDSSTKQDVRARTGATGASKIDGADPLVLNDTSSDTEPFIADGSTSPNTDPSVPGQTLPCPDDSELLAKVEVNHGSEVPTSDTMYTQPITGGVHYFPNGVTLKCAISGDATIIVGKPGSPGKLTYQCNVSTSTQVNLIAIDGAGGKSGGANITFSNNCTIKGVVYSQGNVTSQGSLDVIGTVISYNGDQTHTNAQSTFSFDEDVLGNCPGFEKFFGGGGGSVVILSWQKL